MVTATDDINARLAAVEADIRNINTQLVEINANQRQMRAEHQAETQAMRAEHRTDIRTLGDRINQTNARIDQTNVRITQVETRLNAKIDRVLYVLLGGIITLLIAIALVYLRTGG